MKRRFIAVAFIFAVISLSNHLAAQPKIPADSPAALLKKAKAVLAQTDGKIRVPGLKQPVEVLRDRWGVAHIYAKNADDLFFAQGFIAAQDRLFQIDLWRRVAIGETAEVFGKEALAGDRFARLVKYRGDMNKEWKSYSPDTKHIATAFTSGINAYIDHIGNKLPIEFELAEYKPRKWRPEDVLGRMSGIIMTDNFDMEIYRARLITAVGLEKARLLAPTDPLTKFAPVKGLDLAGINLDVFKDYHTAVRRLKFKSSKKQSNNWVISGKLSASGKPMLASDPHRSIALPSLRYLVHLNAPGWNVIGSGEPGLPGVAIGHNERIAWGFTIVGTDQSDIVVEKLNPKNHKQYANGDRWAPLKMVRETIRVKGQTKPVEVELRFTQNGPIIHVDEKRHRAFVLKWVGSEPGTAAYLGSLAVDRARNWTEFLQAMKAWKVPNENIVYADVDGNIGWVAAALTPVRRNHDGLLPVPANGKYEWQRFLSVKELPHDYNPKRGWLATANHNILPENYKHHIAYDWSPGYRFTRVKERLQSKQKFTLDDFKSIQHDAISIPGMKLAQLLKQLDLKNPRLQKYAQLLRDWDGHLSLKSQAAPLYGAWQMELTKAFYHPRLPKDLHPYIRYLGATKVLLSALENPTKTWFGDTPKSARDQLLRDTFARAVAVVAKRLGNDPVQWTWDKLHTVTFRHPLATLSPAHAKAFNVGPAGRPGDALTPLNTRYNTNFEQIHGASYRHVLDLADWDNGYATSAPGQSGQLGSPHYADLFPLWARGEYFPLAFSRRKVEEVTRHRLWLMPGR